MAITVAKTLTKIFGSRNERLLKRYQRIVERINEFEPNVQPLTDEQLRQRTHELRNGIVAGEINSVDALPEGLAIMREAMDRNIGIRTIFDPESHFDPDKLEGDAWETYDAVQREMIATGASWQTIDIPPAVYAGVRKAYPESRPPFRARCFDVQLIGGLVLFEGRIAEMATGEGKTFVGPLACFLKVLSGLHCHVVTVNDYLVRRDASWVRPAFEHLGFSVGYIQSDMEPGGKTRREQYECDITYGTNSEFGFDYLRDNMKERLDLQVQGPLDFAIVDEVDSILIDEARTPLIISGFAHDDAPKYKAADEVTRKIVAMNKPWDQAEAAIDSAKRAIKAAEGDEDKFKGDKAAIDGARKRRADAEKALEAGEARKEGLVQYYEVELDRKSAHLTHEGVAAAQVEAGVGSFYVGNNMEWPHLMEQSLRAHVVYEKDKDYVVERGQKNEMEVVIVDEYTGRKMTGRQWSDGLHQAVEAKERVPIKSETQTMATITLQNFFKLYKSLAGMTGTAQTEAEEFAKIYELEVVTIPTNRPVVRADHEDRVFRTEREKWEAIIDEIKEESDKGRPVLVGTTSVEKSEMLSNLLRRKYGVEHEVLNAKQHEREAQIVLVAGQQHKNAHQQIAGNVTIATNMAGRGTDIKLAQESHKAGGLHVIGTERHTARRIDNQLRGRGGRQGDPGSSRFYVSLQDDLMKMFAGDWTIKVLGFLGMEEGMAIEDKRISKGILRAQKKVEERNFLSRKNLLEYDEVMDHQRGTFYGMRQQVLEGREIASVIWGMIGDAISDAVDKYITQDYIAATAAEWARMNFNVLIEPTDLRGMRSITDLEEYIKDQARTDVETSLGNDLAEFTGEDPEDPSHWDTKGLQSWAMSRFSVNISQAQMRKLDANGVEEMLKSAALEQIEQRDCAGLMKYLEPNYALKELCNWANEKFGVDIAPEELLEGGSVKASPEIDAILQHRSRDSYALRELSYPADQVLAFAFADSGSTDNPYGADFVRAWVAAKYHADLPLEHIRSLSIKDLRKELIALQEKFFEDGGIEEEVDGIIKANSDPDSLLKAVNQRFAATFTAKDLEGDAAKKQSTIVAAGKRFLRRELTELEQFVLIQIFDQSWKDHLYAMDMLKAGIGLQAFAEQDPRIAYKREGFRYFREMMAGVRDKVTDLIFRARVGGQAQQQRRSTYNVTAATHETSSAYGVAENLQNDPGVTVASGGAGGSGTATAEQTSADAKIKTITRGTPRVGRNDPCPCGSGKKFKKCHGADVV